MGHIHSHPGLHVAHRLRVGRPFIKGSKTVPSNKKCSLNRVGLEGLFLKLVPGICHPHPAPVPSRMGQRLSSPTQCLLSNPDVHPSPSQTQASSPPMHPYAPPGPSPQCLGRHLPKRADSPYPQGLKPPVPSPGVIPEGHAESPSLGPTGDRGGGRGTSHTHTHRVVPVKRKEEQRLSQGNTPSSSDSRRN